MNPLSRIAGRAVAPGMFVYDPADPTPSAGGPLLQPPRRTQHGRTETALHRARGKFENRAAPGTR